ncbi:MAG: hypothetical protein ACOVOQ_11155 [Flavobacterium sp.]
MNIKFSQIDYPLLANVINNINETLICPKFKEHSTLIEIDTWENVKQVMATSKNVAEKGFAFCISNYFDNGVFKRIIIINSENCDLLDLSEREITAIIYHELGHLLNSFEFVEEPTIMFCMKNGVEYNKTLHEEIHKNNSIQNEVFADSYANQYGYGLELISSFNKHNAHFDDEIGHFEIRVERINNNELMQGNVKPINRNGW